MMNNKVRDD